MQNRTDEVPACATGIVVGKAGEEQVRWVNKTILLRVRGRKDERA
jgi:hypothetical protein